MKKFLSALLKFKKTMINSVGLTIVFASTLFSNNLIDSDTTKFVIHSLRSASDDSMCVVDIDYPELIALKDKIIQDTLNQFLKNEFLDEEEIDISDCDPEIGSTFEINCYIEYNKSNLISIVQYFYIFRGGAHGYYGHNGYNLDLTTGKLLTVLDIIRKDSFKRLNVLAEKKMLQDFEVEKISDIGLFESRIDIPTDQDFFLTQDALVIEFDPYEIGPYVMGDLEIILPWDELTDMLQPEFKVKMD